MTTHTPRHPRRKGSEPMDATPQPAPTGPVRPSGFIMGDDLGQTDQNRKADDARKADNMRHQAECQAHDRKAALVFEDNGDERRRQAQEAVRRERQADERHRQEVADDHREAVTARNAAQIAAATRRTKRREAEENRKPVEIFDRIDTKKIVGTLEAVTKFSIVGLLAAFMKGLRETGARVATYVTHYMTPPISQLREATPTMPLSRSLPEPEAVLPPSSETWRKPSPAPAAPSPTANFVPKTQADRDWLARKEWNPVEIRQEAREIYGHAAFFAAIGRSLGTGFVSPYDEDVFTPKAPHLLTLLSGGYGQDALQEAQAKFADLQHRLRDDDHAAYKLAPSLMDKAMELERTPESDFALDDAPRDPPDDGAPVFEDDDPEISEANRFTPPTPSAAPSPSMRR